MIFPGEGRRREWMETGETGPRLERLLKLASLKAPLSQPLLAGFVHNIRNGEFEMRSFIPPGCLLRAV